MLYHAMVSNFNSKNVENVFLWKIEWTYPLWQVSPWCHLCTNIQNIFVCNLGATAFDQNDAMHNDNEEYVLDI